MTVAHDADVLIELLDRQFAFVLDQEGARRLRFLPRLIEFIRREPVLAGTIADLRHEAALVVQELTAADALIRQRLATLWEKHADSLAAMLPAEDEAERGRSNVYAPFDSYGEMLRERPPFVFATTMVMVGPEHPTKNLVQALTDGVVTLRQRTEEETGQFPPGFEGAEGELERLKALHAHHVRRWNDATETMAGPAFDRLAAFCQRLNPEPPVDTADPVESISAWYAFSEQVAFTERVYGTRHREPNVGRDDVDVVSAAVVDAAALLVEELRARVLLGRSRQALVRRYAARCEAFDAARLRGIAEENSRRAEALLTREFALYLFDQGLTPILDGTIANLRPDVIDLKTASLFYVEAKQYTKVTRSEVLTWFRQVWSTWGRLRNQHAVPEAFVVIFRRSGRAARLDLPNVIRHPHGLRLYPVFADLAEEAGSSEGGRTVCFAEADLLFEHEQGAK